jgi:hypothetical protein
MAAGIWAALSPVTILSVDDPSVRAGVPASPLWLPIAGALAALVPAFRRRPGAATPAALALLPWLPLPLPSVALIWTGRLAWMPVALAALAAITAGGNARQGHESSGSGDRIVPGRIPRLHLAAAGLATLFAAGVVAWSLAPRLPGGDEPHYLIITQSLLKDGDIRIANNHANRDYLAYYGGDLRPDKIQDGRNGEVYSIHAPGTSVLVLPAFAAFGYRGAQLTIILIAALTGSLVWCAGWLATGSRAAAWASWAGVCLSATFLFQSVTIFPDGPGALVTAVAVVLAAALSTRQRRVTGAQLIAAGSLLAALPWLHTRFSVLAAGLGLVLIWQILRERTSAPDRLRRIATLLGVPMVSAAGWFAYFQVIYGTPNPSAPYGPDPQTSLAYIPGGIVALLLDQQFGLLAATPILAVAIGAIFWRKSSARSVDARPDARLVRPLVLVAFAYFAAVGVYWMWWAGVPATPARFSAAALPLLAIPLAVGWARAGILRPFYRVLLGISIALSVLLLMTDRGALLWNHRETMSAAWLKWTGTAANVPRGLPSFFWRLDPGNVQSELGFALHTALTVGIVTGLALLAAIAVRRTRVSAAATASWWVALAVMAVVQCGWLLNDSPRLDAASSQVRVLDEVAGGQRAVEIRPWTTWASLQGPPPLQIRAASDAGQELEAVWTFGNVPAGRYRLDALPAAGRATIRMGRFEVASVPLGYGGREFALPAGARALNVATGRVDRLELVPLAVSGSPAEPAVALADYGAWRVYFSDDNVFIENDGFWVRGGKTTGFVVSGTGTGATLILENGPMSNAVSVASGGRVQDLPLHPSESRALPLPLDTGTVRVTITSPAGFRPSDVSASADRRYLGVRVGLRQ